MLWRYLRGPDHDPEYYVTADELLVEARETFRAFDPEGRYRLAE